MFNHFPFLEGGQVQSNSKELEKNEKNEKKKEQGGIGRNREEVPWSEASDTSRQMDTSCRANFIFSKKKKITKKKNGKNKEKKSEKGDYVANIYKTPKD